MKTRIGKKLLIVVGVSSVFFLICVNAGNDSMFLIFNLSQMISCVNCALRLKFRDEL